MSVGIAVLGCGRIGQVHARAVASVGNTELRAIADPLPEAARAAQQVYGGDIRTIEEIETSSDIDAVIICTPTDTHAGLIERFCRAGKAVFCEKPVDLEIARVKRCLNVVEESGGRLMVGFQRRFDPDFRALKSAIVGGRIGDIEMVTLTSRDPGPPPYDYIERSGGIFRDMTIHDFDVARWLLDEEVETVQAAASVLVDRKIGELGDYDSVNVILRTASGKQCAITNSRRATYGYDQRIEVLGSRGMASAENRRPVSVEIAGESGFNRPALHNFFMTRYVQAYAAEIEAFVHCVINNTAPSPSGRDGLAALMLAEAARRSVLEGRSIRVSEIV